MKFNTLQDLLDAGVKGRTVLVRSDFNVPLDENGKITDPGRIKASLPTLKTLLENGARVVVMAHLGRPKGEVNPKYSLAPVAEELGKELGKFVPLAQDTVGADAIERTRGLNDGDILLIENVRFDARETSKVDAEREALAADFVKVVGEGAAYVSDGFGVVHRKQASVYDVAKLLPAYAGLLVEKEVSVLGRLIAEPEHPYTVILGGSKVSDKLNIIQSLAPRVDNLIVAGGMCYTFLAAQGHSVGTSLLEEPMIETCKKLLADFADVITLPEDLVVAEQFAKDADSKVVPADQIPDGWMGLDVGPKTIEKFAPIIKSSKMLFWNGPVGVFEFPKFSNGTRAVAQTIIDATAEGTLSVIGGGDSAAAVRTLGLPESGFSHISTGGGASLELLEGKTLPGLAVLAKSE